MVLWETVDKKQGWFHVFKERMERYMSDLVPSLGMRLPFGARSFLLMAFGFTWLVAGVAALAGVDVNSSAYSLVAGGCMFGPAIAALVQWRVIERAPWSDLGLHPKGVRWPWLSYTVVLGVAIIPLCLLVIAGGGHWGLPGFGHVEVTGARFAASVAEIMTAQGITGRNAGDSLLSTLPGGLILVAILGSAVLAAFTVNLPFMLGEELGWRGYLFQKLAGWSPAQRIGFTGPVWGIWHAPLIFMGHNYPGHPVVGCLLMVVFCTVLAILFDWCRTRATSVWAPCVLHGIINGSAGAFALFAWNGHVLVASPAGLAGLVALFLLAAVLLFADAQYRRSFFRVPQPPPTANFTA